ncbi:hypothetical protein O3Q52_19995 [Streptomyces sp. ActVer]|uniref:hypothetical protein n=1 Tax=Streptomyces sp. ActVer TaxID=3014558 RepID=UPI0022B58C74|nr:hypothetical protein [Streptomyces sp. ActVer]MCZ4510429.1 hypothetical protein [Streptomyces sp. ActVer]
MTSTPHPHNDCPDCRTRETEARERREADAEAAERSHRDNRQRISDLEYGIDAALEEIAGMDEGSDPRKVIETVRHYLATYRAIC